MNMIQQAHMTQKLLELALDLEAARKLLFDVGFLGSFHLRQADASLKAAIDNVRNASNHVSRPISPPLAEE
jgi:hypothetical protein